MTNLYRLWGGLAVALWLATPWAFAQPKPPSGAPLADTPALVAALAAAEEGAVLELAAGVFELSAPLDLKPGQTLRGAGPDKTMLRGAAAWTPSTASLPDPEMTTKGLATEAYLIRLPEQGAGVTIAQLALEGPQLHGAIYGRGNHDLHLHQLRIQDTLWCGVRTFSMQRAKIHDCEFIDAGGRWSKGQPGEMGGITGGAIFAVWMADCEIAHNRFRRTQDGQADEFYGVKVRQAKRCRVHHNTIETNFSLEFPFENDEDVEIDHNICTGTISLPKYGGGPVPSSGRTFHVHHNWLRDSYAIEFVRNGIEIDHNLFDFDLARDHGNLISGFGKAPASGPAKIHNNLISNPGRGVIWINEPYHRLEFFNNEVRAQTTATPRKDGLFGFHKECRFAGISIRDNVFHCAGQPRPLLRSAESYAAQVENNRLTNIADADQLANPQRERPVGLTAPLEFHCGVHDEVVVRGWQATPARPAR